MKYIPYIICALANVPFFPAPFNVGVFGFALGIIFVSAVQDYFWMKYR